LNVNLGAKNFEFGRKDIGKTRRRRECAEKPKHLAGESD